MFQRKTVDPVCLDSVFRKIFRSGDAKIQNLSLLLGCNVIEQIIQAVDSDPSILHGRTYSFRVMFQDPVDPGDDCLFFAFIPGKRFPSEK